VGGDQLPVDLADSFELLARVSDRLFKLEHSAPRSTEVGAELLGRLLGGGIELDGDLEADRLRQPVLGAVTCSRSRRFCALRFAASARSDPIVTRPAAAARVGSLCRDWRPRCSISARGSGARR
jgi:hypothetical protein